METIAVYWESKVKVYSISQVTDLSMARLVFPSRATVGLGKTLTALGDAVGRFELVTQDYIDSALSQMNLFYDRSKQGELETTIDKWSKEAQTTVTFVSALELIYLHGPHFQDRFGIIDIVFSALKKTDITIIAAGCAGTTIYIAVADKQALPAARILRETFIIPTTN